jgi:hypothetical protein
MATIAPPPVNTPIADANGQLNSLWSRYYVSLGQTITTAFAPIDAAYWTSTTNPTLTNEQNLGALSPSGYLKVTVGAGIAVPSTTATIPSADLTGALPALDGSALTALNASALSSGTVPDARFPATFPAASAVNLTNLNASNLASGTVPDARFPATLPSANGSQLTALKATALTYAVVTVTFGMSPYAVLASDNTLLVDATAGAVTITLPAATSGRILTVKKVDASANACTLSGTVDTVVNPTIGTQFQSRVIQGDGSNWNILAGYL